MKRALNLYRNEEMEKKFVSLLQTIYHRTKVNFLVRENKEFINPYAGSRSTKLR